MLRFIFAILGVALLSALSACADTSSTKFYQSASMIPKGIVSASLSVMVVGDGPYGHLTPSQEESISAMVKKVFTDVAQKEGVTLRSGDEAEAVEIKVRVSWHQKGSYLIFVGTPHRFTLDATVTDNGTYLFSEPKDSGDIGCNIDCGDLAGAAKKHLTEQAKKVMARL